MGFVGTPIDPIAATNLTLNNAPRQPENPINKAPITINVRCKIRTKIKHAPLKSPPSAKIHRATENQLHELLRLGRIFSKLLITARYSGS